MDNEKANPDVLDLGPIGKMLGSQRTSVFESLVVARRRGLTIPQIVTTSGVPTATVHRIITGFSSAGLIVIVGKDGKAPVYGLNPANRAAVETSRSLMGHARRIAAMKAGLAEHGGTALPDEPSIMTVHLTTGHGTGARGRPRVSVDLEADA